ncbi:hypothetical protein AMJ82_06915 [candidate division TA06 bacterium SM23_40]|uniref:Phosphodiesterase n=1 Tax=candidate division TA06 bacterium SM23_40 TaxID=1703774 RepID=A0A0S8G7F7_UNCT6|nr:MAG: hypothetical protein AMJ82_06915 [candidate division TA06 bacterium SM23_40]
MTRTVDRAVVIGLDGATFDVIDPMVARGELPNMARVLDRGARGTLESSIPPVTAPAWVSFMTGVNPGKHGIFNFSELSPDAIRRGVRHLITSRSIKSPTIWEIVDRAGGRTVAINVPVTYPCWPIRGCMISGVPAPTKDDAFVHPPALLSALENALGEYPLEQNPPRGVPVDLNEWTRRYRGIEEQRHRAATYLIDRDEWDLFVVVYGLTDRIQHLCWSHYRHGGALEEAIPEAYRTVDRWIGELMAKVGDETTVLVMSDHGFGDLDKAFCTTRWLNEHGFLCYAKPRWPGIGAGLAVRRATVGRILSRCGFGGLAARLPDRFQGIVVRLPMLRTGGNGIDWEKSDAFAGNFGIYINVRDGGAGAASGGGEYGDLRRRIASELERLVDLETGECVVDTISFREEVYCGEFAELAPDILFQMKEMRYQQHNRPTCRELFTTQTGGTHRMDGILIAAGPHAASGARFEKASLVDIAPTLLYLLGLPVPAAMDGRVLIEGLDEELLRSREVKVTEAEIARIDLEERGYRKDEEEAIMRQLAGLGYLD